MDRTRKLWVIVGLACLSFGVCMSRLTSTSASGLRSSSVKPIPASLGQPRMTLHASSRSSELRYADAADLQSDQVENEGGTPTDLLQVDVNNDGMADLVAAYQTAEGPRVRVRLGSSSGELGQPQSYPVHSSLVKAAAFGDFNGDGFRDLIVTSGEEGTAQFLFGNGQGGFEQGPALRLGGNISKVSVGDLNHDAIDDAVFVDREANTVRIALGQDDLGSIEARSLSVDGIGRVFDVKLSDFNNDHLLDMVVAGDNAVSVMYGDGQGSFQSNRRLARSGAVTGLEVADINGDHFPDIAVSGSDGITVWNTKLENGFSKARHFDAGPGANGLIAGYFNADAFVDLAVINSASKQISVLLNRDGNRFSEPMPMDIDQEALVLAKGHFRPNAIEGLAVAKAGGGIVLAVAPQAVTVTVNTTADENDCPSCDIAGLLATIGANGVPGGNQGVSLREAITAINNDNVAHGTTGATISFAGISTVPVANVVNFSPKSNCGSPSNTFWSLNLSGNLPPILAPGTNIDGTLVNTTASGVTNTLGPKVVVNGGATFRTFIITSSAPNCTIKGLSIIGSSNDAITVFSPGNVITGNNIGLSCDTITALANTGAGIQFNSGSINESVTNNFIAANTTNGIIVNGVSQSVSTPQNNVISGNRIGIDGPGNAKPNTLNGILLQNGATGNTISGNTISANTRFGVEVIGNITSNTIVTANKIGTDPSGTTRLGPDTNPLGNGLGGISIGTGGANGNSKFNQVTSNGISGNTGSGISIASQDNQAQFNIVASNRVGVNVTGSVQLRNTVNGIVLDFSANNNTIGGAQHVSGNQVSGNGVASAGVGLILQGGANNNLIENNDIGPNNLGTGGGAPTYLLNGRQVSNKGGGVLIQGTAFANRLLFNNIAFNNDNNTVSGITHSSTGNFNKFSQNSVFLNPPDIAPATPQIVDSAGQQGMTNAEIAPGPNPPLTTLIKIDSATTVSSSGQSTITGTADFINNAVTANINNSVIEIFVSQRGSETTQALSEAQAFIGQVTSFQVDPSNPNAVDWSANLQIPQPFLAQTQTLFLTATITTGDGSTSPLSNGRVAQIVSGGSQCALSVNPGAVNFSGATIGQTTTQNVVVTNSGSTAVTITALSITPGGTVFSLGSVPLPINLNPTQQATIPVGFTPTNATLVSATLVITNSCTGTTNVALNGTGGAARINVIPISLDFGTVALNQTVQRQLVITNFGTVPLNVTSLVFATGGLGFSLPQPNGFTLQPQTNTTLTVNFTPTTSGTKVDQLRINSNDPINPQVTVPLTGIGQNTQPPVVIVQAPSTGSAVPSGTSFQVRFATTDPSGSGLTTFQIDLSTNGGATFPFNLGTGAATEGINNTNATAPGIETGTAVLRIQVRNNAGVTGIGLSGAFIIGTQPIIISPSVGSGKFKATQPGPNIQVAPVRAINEQTCLPEHNGAGKWVVPKTSVGSLGQRLKQVYQSQPTLVITVRNPSGISSNPLTLTVVE